MRANAVILVIIGLLLLVGTATAAINVKVVGNESWLVAGSGTSAIYTVTVTNSTTDFAIEGATVQFSVDPVYGTINPSAPTYVTTNAAGQASSIFTVSTKSGAATIFALIKKSAVPGVEGEINLNVPIPQNIDHNSPYYPYFTYNKTGEVNNITPFKISITDRFGNRIDNRTGNHMINLHIHGPALDDCFFVGYGHDLLNQPLDSNGNISVNAKLTSNVGSNNILMDSFGSISDKIESITAVATGVPVSITGTISDGGVLPADGASKFVLNFFLFDSYGNRLANKVIWVNTTLPDEQYLFTSNSLGQVQLTYGPKISVFNGINITAISVDNNNAKYTLSASFVNTAPTNLLLSVSPQTLASQELDDTEKAWVSAKVLDILGNPVAGETVDFYINNVENGSFYATADPTLSSSSAVTDSDGNALVYFYPGSFAAWGQTGYNPKATGTCDLVAEWQSKNRTALMQWKNYPYLSVYVSATPETMKIDETIDVTMKVVGDGYKMGAKPVTAILDMDTSASMKNPDGPKSRLENAKDAAKVFVTEMKSNNNNYIGLTSFGIDYNTKFHLSPINDFIFVESQIGNLTQGSQSKELYVSITEGLNNFTASQGQRRCDEIRALIVLNDGNSNIDNKDKMDTLIGLSQNPPPNPSPCDGVPSAKIYVYTVVYMDGKTKPEITAKVLTDMNKLANSTGAKMFTPTNPEELKEAYRQIAEELKILAGVDASMVLDFTNVEVNSTKMSGGEVFDYVPVEPFVPLIPEGQPLAPGRTRIIWPNTTQSVINQSDDWATDYKLEFDIGTLNISDTWEATYRLKVKQEGVINLFNGSTSKLFFNDGTDDLFVNIPDLFITVTSNITPKGALTGKLELSDIIIPDSNGFTDIVPFTWGTRYSGSSNVTETISYSTDINGPWTQFDQKIDAAVNQPSNEWFTLSSKLDVKKIPRGYYFIQVHAVAPDALDVYTTSDGFYIGISTRQIKLE